MYTLGMEWHRQLTKREQVITNLAEDLLDDLSGIPDRATQIEVVKTCIINIMDIICVGYKRVMEIEFNNYD